MGQLVNDKHSHKLYNEHIIDFQLSQFRMVILIVSLSKTV